MKVSTAVFPNKKTHIRNTPGFGAVSSHGSWAGTQNFLSGKAEGKDGTGEICLGPESRGGETGQVESECSGQAARGRGRGWGLPALCHPGAAREGWESVLAIYSTHSSSFWCLAQKEAEAGTFQISSGSQNSTAKSIPRLNLSSLSFIKPKLMHNHKHEWELNPCTALHQIGSPF